MRREDVVERPQVERLIQALLHHSPMFVIDCVLGGCEGLTPTLEIFSLHCVDEQRPVASGDDVRLFRPNCLGFERSANLLRSAVQFREPVPESAFLLWFDPPDAQPKHIRYPFAFTVIPLRTGSPSYCKHSNYAGAHKTLNKKAQVVQHVGIIAHHVGHRNARL